LKPSINLKKQLFKKSKISHGGGGPGGGLEVSKKCHVLFDWAYPTIYNFNIYLSLNFTFTIANIYYVFIKETLAKIVVFIRFGINHYL